MDSNIVVNVLFYNLTENRNVLRNWKYLNRSSKNWLDDKSKSFPRLKIKMRMSLIII